MRHLWPALPATLMIVLAAGCGMQPADTRIQARSQSGINQYSLEIVEGEFVCPNVVSINNQTFDVKAVISGEVEDNFGPFVPCLTAVDASPGTNTCSGCQQEYRIGEPLGEDEQGPPMALPKLRCPHEDAHNDDRLVDPAAVLVKGSKDSVLGFSNCPTCRKYFTIKETDLVATIDVHEEVHCPSCDKPLDPTVNACANSACKLGGVVRVVDDFEGPCWRCGGVSICPNCKGSGKGNLGMFGTSPPDCWMCGKTGRCPECEEGFSRYEGTLPKSYTAWGREQALHSKQRKWKFKRDQAAPAPSGGDEDLGDPEDDTGEDG